MSEIRFFLNTSIEDSRESRESKSTVESRRWSYRSVLGRPGV